MKNLLPHQEIIASVQSETLRELIQTSNHDLNEFLLKENIFLTHENESLIQRLPIAPLSLFDRCPSFMRKVELFPIWSSGEPVQFMRLVVRWMIKRSLIKLTKIYFFVKRGLV